MANWNKFQKKSTAIAQKTVPAQADNQEVARVAYELYEQGGCMHGHDVENWFKAEEIVKQRAQKGS